MHHNVPAWVEQGALFHIRIALDRSATKPQAQAQPQRLLTNADLGATLLSSAELYHDRQRWHIGLFLLMPDHLHALLAFPSQESMSMVIGDWKRFQNSRRDVVWQEGFFDHRLRDDELGQELENKANYIRNNPVAAGLCARPEDWRWKIDLLAP